MRKGTQASPEARLAFRLGRLKKSMPPEDFARFTEADGALKWCPTCKQLLPVPEFHKSQRTWDGLYFRCKACNSAAASASNRKRREDPELRAIDIRRSTEWRAQAKADGRFQAMARKHQLKTLYGLTPGARDAMLAAQGYRCALCRKPFKDAKNTHIDHDHACCPGYRSCGKCIRAILCGHCNTGLGRFHDSPALLRRAARYLEHARTQGVSAEPGDGECLLWDDAGT